MAKVTSSSTRSTRKSTQPVRQGQDPYRANRQAVSKASVSESGKGVTPGSAGGKVTTGQGKQRVVLPELPPKPKPTAGTTNTIRATGGNSSYARSIVFLPQAPHDPNKSQPLLPIWLSHSRCYVINWDLLLQPWVVLRVLDCKR
jgi:hypothetical protein